MSTHIDIVFDGPPSHKAGRFVEVENDRGASIRFGEWVERDYGLWALRIPGSAAAAPEMLEALEDLTAAAPNDPCWQRARAAIAKATG